MECVHSCQECDINHSDECPSISSREVSTNRLQVNKPRDDFLSDTSPDVSKYHSINRVVDYQHVLPSLHARISAPLPCRHECGYR